MGDLPPRNLAQRIRWSGPLRNQVTHTPGTKTTWRHIRDKRVNEGEICSFSAKLSTQTRSATRIKYRRAETTDRNDNRERIPTTPHYYAVDRIETKKTHTSCFPGSYPKTALLRLAVVVVAQDKSCQPPIATTFICFFSDIPLFEKKRGPEKRIFANIYSQTSIF